MNETTKAAPRRAAMALFQRALKGKGIDIGGGGDPLTAAMGFPGITECESFDREQGDAYEIHTLRPIAGYDFVYSSQTLEDMENHLSALARWSMLVRQGGYMVITVPDFELYERGRWPSIGNGAHRTCWGMGHPAAPLDSGVPYVDVLDVMAWLPRFLRRENFGEWRVLLVQLVDTNYDYNRRDFDQTLGNAEAFIEFIFWRKG